MQIIEKTPEKVVMRMEANTSLANAIRRSIDEIPILAIDEVEIFKNDSALYDETVSHRLGLIPLKTDSKMNEKTRVELKLVKTGPCTVYSGDLVGNAEVIHKGIPITLLEKGQSLEIVATAKLGKTTEHAKHAPGLCYYRYLMNVKSKNPQINSLVDRSRSALKSEKKGDTIICDLQEAIVDEIVKIDKESVSESNEILLFVESYGQMKAEELLANAIDSLSENLSQFKKAID